MWLLCILLSATAIAEWLPPAHRIEYPDSGRRCIYPDGTLGLCLNAKYCDSAQTDKWEPKHCYYERFEQHVCCIPGNKLLNRVDRRPSATFCYDSHRIEYPITNGETTAPDEFPYMTALGWETSKPNVYEYKCGGVLISPNYVLTAAHCAYVEDVAPAVVVSGGVHLTDSSRARHRIAEVIEHPDYDPEFVYNDIALLRLEDTYFFDYFIRFACVWANYPLNNRRLTAIGYGHTRFAGNSSDQLLKANLVATSNKECRQHYDEDFTYPKGVLETQICAKDPEKKRDTCQGDSGGPIISMVYANRVHNELPYVVGITSFGQGCAGGPPGIYTRVSAYVDWIEGHVWPSGYATYKKSLVS